MDIDYSRRIFGLDLLRAIAILGVLGSHILWIFPEANSGGLVYLLQFGGVMGVELFFVLSGFLIGRILLRQFLKPHFHRGHFKYFLVRRWFRTLPNYYAVLLLNILLVTAIGRELPDTIAHYFGFLQNFFSGMDLFFTESWSLPIEEFAYIIAPMLLLLVVGAFAKAKRDTLFLVVTLGVIIFFITTKVIYTAGLSQMSLQHWNIELKAVVWYRIDAIYYGVLAGYLSLIYPRHWKKYAAVCLVLGIVLFFLVQIIMTLKQWTPESNPWFWYVAYLPLMSVVYCFFLPILSQWKTKPALLGKTITTISVLSYAVYLLHYGIILQTMRWIWPIESLTSLTKALYVIVYLILVFGLSYLWYRNYEKPMMDIRDKPYIKSRFGRP